MSIMRQALASALHFFIVFLFFCVGLLCVCLPHFRVQRLYWFFQLATAPDRYFHWVGLGLFAFAFLLLLGFYGLNRGRTLRITMGEIDGQLIAQALEEELKVPVEVEVIHKKKIEIHLFAPLFDEPTLEKQEKILQELLSKRFGYTGTFDLILRIPASV